MRFHWFDGTGFQQGIQSFVTGHGITSAVINDTLDVDTKQKRLFIEPGAVRLCVVYQAWWLEETSRIPLSSPLAPTQKELVTRVQRHASYSVCDTLKLAAGVIYGVSATMKEVDEESTLGGRAKVTKVVMRVRGSDRTEQVSYSQGWLAGE